jgi:hypothetical protein
VACRAHAQPIYVCSGTATLTRVFLQTRVAMYSARSFQQVYDIVRQWWVLGWQVNGRHALTDADPQADLLRYCATYCAKLEWQTRGNLHLHVLAWDVNQPSIPRIETPRGALGSVETVD